MRTSNGSRTALAERREARATGRAELRLARPQFRLPSVYDAFFATVFLALFVLIASILYVTTPRGVVTSTDSPFFLPISALPSGDSFERRWFAGSASVEPTIVNSLLRPLPSLTLIVAPRWDFVLRELRAVDDPRVADVRLELQDAALDEGLFLLRVFVLGVFGDVAEFFRLTDALVDLSAGGPS